MPQGTATRPTCWSAPSGRSPHRRCPTSQGSTRSRGPCFHSARWEHEHDLSGRRVAVIGTGASAAQIIPELAKGAQTVHVFQRTPQWILPRSDKPFTEEQKRRFARNRIAVRRHRQEIYWAFENTIAFRRGRMGPSSSRRLRGATSTTG